MAMVVANQTNSSGSNTGKIVGGVIGGVIVIAAAGGGLYGGKKLYDRHQARQKSGTGGVETGSGDWQELENEEPSQYETGDALPLNKGSEYEAADTSKVNPDSDYQPAGMDLKQGSM